jgi:hypothetical protein
MLAVTARTSLHQGLHTGATLKANFSNFMVLSPTMPEI